MSKLQIGEAVQIKIAMALDGHAKCQQAHSLFVAPVQKKAIQ